MAKWSMPNIVEQSSKAYDVPIIFLKPDLL
jgi:hypothetical protein